MKLSTKGRYGVRAMVELALHYGEGPVLLKDIAKQQEISERYLEQLIIPLKAAGLVKSTRGAHGGYTLATPPEGIRLCELIQALEGPLTLVECINAPAICHRSSTCATREVWKQMENSITNVLDSITLADLAKRQKSKETPDALTYHI